MNKNNLLVTAVDDNYINMAKQFFASAYFNSGFKGDYMLLAHNISEENLYWFREKGILIKNCQPLISSMPQKWPPVVLDKFYLFSPEFKKWENIIYLDSDMIIKASLNDLINTKEFASLNIDQFFKKTKLKKYFNKSSQCFDQELFDKIKNEYDLNSIGFSGGVFAFNTKIIEDDLFLKIKKLIPILKFSNWGEEIILNLIFNNKWQKLPMIYNLNPIVIRNICGIKLKNQRGIIFHYDKKEKLSEDDPFYQERKINEIRAEKIDLNDRPRAKERWNNKMIYTYQLYLYFRHIIYVPYYQINGLIGRVGKYISKNHQGLYLKLKK